MTVLAVLVIALILLAPLIGAIVRRHREREARREDAAAANIPRPGHRDP